eukprot:493802_1
MLFALFLLLNIAIHIAYSVTWTTETINRLPQHISNMIVGHSTDSDFPGIWLIGGYDGSGYINPIPILYFDTNEETFYTDAATIPISVKNITSNAQSFTQIGDIIYMVKDNTFATFNTATKVFTQNWNNVNIPINQNSATAFSGCLTNIEDKYLIVLGGKDNEITYLKSIHIYDISNNIWLSNPPDMRRNRRIFTCNVVNQYMYAIGGETSYNNQGQYPIYTNSIEKLYIGNMNNIQNENWIQLSNTLVDPTAFTRSVVVNDFIYIIGGYQSNPFGYTSKVYIIDTNNNDNVYVDSNMAYALSSVNTIFLNNYIYIMGGHDGGLIPTISPLNEVVDIWQISSYIPTPAPTATPITSVPTTKYPTTNIPTTISPTTIAPSTVIPTTIAPSTSVPSTTYPTAIVPSTVIPTTIAPSTNVPSTTYPTTLQPSESPTTYPSKYPSIFPSKYPSKYPSNNPT